MLLLLRFAHQHLDFRYPEFTALLELFELEEGIHINVFYDEAYFVKTPFIKVEVLDLLKIPVFLDLVSRSVCIINCYEVLAFGASRPELVANVQALEFDKVFAESSPLEFKYEVDSFGKKFSGNETRAIIRDFEFLPFTGNINLLKPQVTYTIVIRSNIANERDPVPEEWYYTRHLQSGNRDAIFYFNLKKRRYIGITSMDAELSLIMSNMGKLKAGHLVLDPFVGTGSFLVTAAYFGAFTMGSDIDGRQLRGKIKGNFREAFSLQDGTMPEYNVYTNAEQYGLQEKVLDVLVFDNTKHPWRTTELFDVILTDPPYGVRAGAKKIVASDMPRPAIGQQDQMDPFYPKTEAYFTDEVVQDLIDFAASYLKVGGRLVYWQPTMLYDAPKDADSAIKTLEDLQLDSPPLSTCRPSIQIPSNSAMRLVAASEQRFNGWSRWLVTMEKHRRSDEPDTLGKPTSFGKVRHFGDDLMKRIRP